MDFHDFFYKYIEIGGIGTNYEAFSDVDYNYVYWSHVYWAYTLGIVKGYGDGTFQPGREISRQEAAVLLLNTYDFYGEWEIQEMGLSFCEVYADSDLVAEWAIESAMFMYQSNIMRGVDAITFSPLGTYTVEQCIISFLRLYENAPTSRQNSNITHFMTFADTLADVLAGPTGNANIDTRYDLEDITVIYSIVGGLPHGGINYFLWILYGHDADESNDGELFTGRREILQRLRNAGGHSNVFPVRDLELSDDESTITFSLFWGEGLHYYSVDLITAKVREV